MLCCLGGEVWDEQFVAVALVAGAAVVGNLCPRCLTRPPGEAAHRFHAAADYVRRLAHERLTRPSPPSADGDGELLTRLARLKQETAERLRVSGLVRVMSEAGRLHSVQMRRANVWHDGTPMATTNPGDAHLADGRLPETHDAVVVVGEQADELARLGDGLAALGEWPVTVDRVIEAERLAVIGRYGLASKDVRRVVDGRYAAFLAGPG